MLLRRRDLWLVFCGLLAAVRAAALPAPLSDAGYAVIDIPEAGRQFVSGPVLALAHTADGQLVVGSNQLAVFDGQGWQRIAVPDVTRFLSLAAEPGPAERARVRIWFSADGALGYVERTATGEWQPTLLNAPLAAAGLTDLSEIRRVEADGRGGAVFVTRSRVLRWDGTAFRVWELPNPTRLYSFMYREALHLCQPGAGLLRMSAAGPELWLAPAELPDGEPVIAMIDGADGQPLAFTNSDRLFRRTPGGWSEVAETSAQLKGRRPTRALRVDADTIAVGTAYGGVALIRNDGSLISLVNTRSGLPDDTTDKILSDGGGGLWISTGSGIARLTGPGRASLFDQRTWLTYGPVQRVIEHADRPWVITSRRTYELVPTPALEPTHFRPLEKFWPHLQDGAVRGEQLWLSGSGGLCRVRDGVAVPEPAEPADTFQLAAPDWLPEGLVYARQDSLHALLPAGPDWRSLPLGARFESPVASLLLDRAGRLWVSTHNGQVRAFAWDDATQTLRLLAQHEPGRGLPAGVRSPVLAPWGEGVAILTEAAVLACRDPRELPAPVPGLAEFVADHALALPDGSMLWNVQHKSMGAAARPAIIRVRLAPDSAGLAWEPVVVPGLDHIGTISSMNVTGAPGRQVVWIGGDNALLRIEGTRLDQAHPAPAAQLRGVRSNGARRAALRPAARQVFDAQVGQLAFEYSAGAGAEDLFYQSRLREVESDWSPPQAAARREFTGLSAGRYDFEVRTVDRFGRPGPVTAYAFRLEAPWYRQPWALASWTGLLGLAAWVAVKWRFRQLQRQAARLNQLVNDRTRELSLSNTARTEFLDSLSHELRRPLNGILSLIRRLEETSLSDRQREHAGLLRQGTESLARVCDEVLNFSALEYGAVALEERPFRLGDLLEAAIAEFAGAGPRPPVRRPAELADDFIGDDAKLKTVVGNFLANAFKHAAGAPVEITVSCAARADGAADVLIEVVDGGPGIPAEEQELIFKRFVRGSHAKQHRVPGTGIGLATCRAMARLMGGSVGIESPSERAREHGWPGPGATFFVSLPLRRSAPVPV